MLNQNFVQGLDLFINDTERPKWLRHLGGYFSFTRTCQKQLLSTLKDRTPPLMSVLIAGLSFNLVLSLALMQSQKYLSFSNLSFAFHLFDHLPKREIFPLKFSCLSNFRPRMTHTEGGQEMEELESNYICVSVIISSLYLCCP